MSGHELASRSGSSLVAELFERDVILVVDLDGEALEEECSAGRRTKGMLSIDMAQQTAR